MAMIMSSAHERFAGVEGIESLSTNTMQSCHKSLVAPGPKFETKRRENSLFDAELPLVSNPVCDAYHKCGGHLLVDARKLRHSCCCRCRKVRRSLFRKVCSRRRSAS